MDMYDRIVLTGEHDTKPVNYHRLGLPDLVNKFATSTMTGFSAEFPDEVSTLLEKKKHYKNKLINTK